MQINTNYQLCNSYLNNRKSLPTHKNTSVNDTFVKNTPSFTAGKDDAHSFEHFSLWAKRSNFLSQIEELVQRTAKILGSGSEGTIYEIPENDNWVIKKYKRGNLFHMATPAPTIEKVDDILPDLNVGQNIALVKMPCGPHYTSMYYILEKQTGKAIGVKHQDAGFVQDFNFRKHNAVLNNLSNLPDESYDKLIDDITYIQDSGYDIAASNPENFLFDSEHKAINFVDINDKKAAGNTLYGEVLFGLLDGFFTLNLMKSEGNDELKQATIDASEIIVDKYTNAMLRKGAKFTEGKLFNHLLDSKLLDKPLNKSNKQDKIAELKSRNLM